MHGETCNLVHHSLWSDVDGYGLWYRRQHVAQWCNPAFRYEDALQRETTPTHGGLEGDPAFNDEACAMA